MVSAGLGFPPDLPLLCDPESQVAFLTPSEASLPETAARVEYVRARREDGSLDLPAASSELHDRLHVRTLLCEGGPHLNAELLSAGLVDELFLSVSPLLAGDDPADARPPTPCGFLAGSDFDPPLALELHRRCSSPGTRTPQALFLRYAVSSSPAGGVRETGSRRSAPRCWAPAPARRW